MPLTLPYVRVYQSLGIVRSVRELDTWSAPLRAYVGVTRQHVVHQALGVPLEEAGELSLYPGVLVTALAAVALTRLSRETAFWGLVAVGAFVLSLGTGVRWVRGGPPLAIPLPYTLLYSYLPGFGALRVPARWGVVVTLALSVLAAIAIDRLQQRRPLWWQRIITLGVLVIVVIEQAAFPVPLANLPQFQPTPLIYSWLGAPEQQDIHVVLELPVGKIPRGSELQRIIWRQFYSRAHWKQLPVSYSGLIPFGMTDLLSRVQRLPDDQTLRYLQLLGIDTLVIHREDYAPETLSQLLKAFDHSPLVRHRGDIGAASVYTIVRDDDVGALSALSGAATSIYVSGDDRAPGLVALALIRRWQAQGVDLYGPGRIRYYLPLAPVRPGQVFTYGLLASDEDPARYGFRADRRRWQGEGFVLYEGDPALRINLDLGTQQAGVFHPIYQPAIDLTITSDKVQVAGQTISWTTPITQAQIELDVASSVEQTLMIGAEPVDLRPGLTTITHHVPLSIPIHISGRDNMTALLRLRVRSEPALLPTTAASGIVASARVSFVGSRLVSEVNAAGSGELMLDIWGAAAYDDRPIHLAAGSQPVPSAARTLRYEIDLLMPTAPWLAESQPPQDGRYIAYLKDTSHPDAPGTPIATFNIRGGAVVDPLPVPLSLTAIR